MKPFIHDDFLLETETAKVLYHETASNLPIIDYHNHLSPSDIAEDKLFQSITEIWLKGDHYKWRAMRAVGVNEHFISGNATDKEKFIAWAETVPKTLRNPLYHWTHLELKRYFGIDELLSSENAEQIYDLTSERLRSDEYSTQSLLKKMNVEVVCTTDDPIDNLKHHESFSNQENSFKMLPTYRPDRAMNVDNELGFCAYVSEIESAYDQKITDLNSFIQVLKERHDEFHKIGGRLSDHGLTKVPAEAFTKKEVEASFIKLLNKKALTPLEQSKLQSYFLIEFAKMDFSKNWVMQIHIGALRNTNTRLFDQIGKDAGTDSIADYPHGLALSKFLDGLDQNNELPKTILYNLNPSDNEVFASMAGNFNDGSFPGKIQWGSAWWFLDQLDGMEKQINTLSNIGLLSVFVGMLTDSRSFLSFPRHEYFRRLFCNILGNDVEKGVLPNDVSLLSELVENVCYSNAKDYFRF